MDPPWPGVGQALRPAGLELAPEERASLSPAARAYVEALEAAVAVLQAPVAQVQAPVADLQARLKQDSSNSSRPPSSDPPWQRRQRPKAPPAEPGGRRPGGQAGHPGQHRALRSEAEVDRLVPVVPEQCGWCGEALPAEAQAGDPADERQQVTELPPVAATVTEYRLAARRCRRCGHLTRAARPAEAGPRSFGPRLQAVAALLSGRFRLSRREVAVGPRLLFGAAVAVGSVSALEQTTSAALGPVWAEARAAVEQAPVANCDETGWRQQRRLAWLWTAVTASVTVFRVAPSRAGQVVRELLGPAWQGIVGSDRYGGYSWLAAERRQVCWAHLRRDFKKLVDDGGPATPLGEALLAVHHAVFSAWHRFQGGQTDRAGLQLELAPLQARMRPLLEDGAARGNTKMVGVCEGLLKLWPALWTFATVDGVDPTNNAAEQALRPAVLWRKNSFGSHSAAGSRYAERMLTVTASCRQQGRDPLAFLVAAIQAHQLGTPAPSLLPAAIPA